MIRNTVLNRMVRVSLSNEMTFEQNPEWNERIRPRIRGKPFQTEGTAGIKT